MKQKTTVVYFMDHKRSKKKVVCLEEISEKKQSAKYRKYMNERNKAQKALRKASNNYELHFFNERQDNPKAYCTNM